MPFDAAALDLPIWHLRRPNALMLALAGADHAAPRLGRLAAFLLPAAPRHPLASQNIRAITLYPHSDPFPLSEAVTLPWLTLDSEKVRNVIAVDIDHPDGPERAAALAAYGLPRLTLILDPWSGRSHAVWRLASPVLTGKGAHVGPVILFDLAGRMLAAALGGTLLPARGLLKNPWGLTANLIGARRRRMPTPAVPVIWEAYQAAGAGLMWHTQPGELRTVELREVIAALADDYGELIAAAGARKFRKKRGEPDARGRNCTLFDLVRWWAYDHTETDAATIEAEAARVNATFATPLLASEVKATARSIARFMRGRYRPQAIRYPRPTAGMTQAERNAFTGKKAAAARMSNTDAKIAAALTKLRAEGETITQAALATAAHVSERTIRSRWPSRCRLS